MGVMVVEVDLVALMEIHLVFMMVVLVDYMVVVVEERMSQQEVGHQELLVELQVVVL